MPSPSESIAVEDRPLDRLTSIVESALLTIHGSKKAAAIEVGCDQSQMQRQLRQMSAAGDAFLAKLGEQLQEAYGHAKKSKRQIAMERLPELLALMLQAVEE